MILLQSSLPCSENFFRYKKNYEKFVNQGPKSQEGSPKTLGVPVSSQAPAKKSIASPKIMSKLSPIQTMFKGNIQTSSILQKYGANATVQSQSTQDVQMSEPGDEQIDADKINQIAISNFKSSKLCQLDKKTRQEEVDKMR